MRYFTFSDLKGENICNVRLGGFKHLAAAINKAKEYPDAHVIDENRKFVYIRSGGEKKFQSVEA